MNNIDPNCDTSCCVRHNHTRTGGSLNVVSVYALTRATRDNLVNGLTSLPLPPSSGLDMGTWLMGCPAQDSGGGGAPPDHPRSVILLLGCDSKRSNRVFAASAASEQHLTLSPLPGFPPRRRPRYERQGREGATSGSGGVVGWPQENFAPSRQSFADVTVLGFISKC